MVTTTKQVLLAGSEIETALFWRQRDFFQGPWWQNEEKLKTAYEMLLEESQSRNMTIITLAEDYNYFDYFGYANTRVYALQAMIGDLRTGVYSASTMVALQNVYISKNVDFTFDEPELTPDNIKVIWEWYGGYSEFSKKGAYLLENGLGDIIEGVTTLGVAYYGTRSVETVSVTENITESARQNKTVWTGKDKYVPELANEIEGKFPGRVKAVERIIYDANGNRYL